MSIDHLAGLLCHHDGDDTGHELAPSCPMQIKPSTRAGWPELRIPSASAAGTCPTCGRTGVKVTARKRFGRQGGNRSNVFLVPLGVTPELVAHKRPGRGSGPCASAGGAPVETRFAPSPELASWAAVHGVENVR